MNSKFASLAADVATPYKVEIIDPATEDIIRDNSSVDGLTGKFTGAVMFISVWSNDSDRGRAYDKAKRKDLMLRIKKSRTGKVDPDDALEENIAKLASLTESWHLVDRLSGDVIDVPCTPENAADLYSSPGMGWLFVQPWVGANDAANFLPKPSKNSANTPNTTSAEG